MSAKIRTVTLGCKVNQYETELVRQGLTSIGFADAQNQEPADVCVVNTCTVTSEGDAKSRQMIRRLARKNPDAKIVVMGCYATRAPEEVADLPGVSEVVTDKRELPDLMTRFGVVDVPTGLDGFSGRQRAYVKVQDGCLLRCSYCIIPKVRPELSSRDSQHIVDEVQRLVAAGHREVVLTGIHLGHYGVDWNRHKPREQWVRLSHLVKQLAELPGEFRIRLSSIEATEVTRELIGVLKDFPERIVPHLHVCLQSGSDSVLRRMRRRWGTRMFLDRCEMLREALDQPALTTDVIVGFPGETDEEFEQTLETCRRARFSKVHVFPFSRRRGTPAAEMEDQVDKDVQADRVARLIELETELRRDYFRSLVGRRVQLLVETARGFTGIGDGSAGGVAGGGSQYLMRGTSCRYAPVELFADQPAAPGTLIDVQVQAADDQRLLGR
ncbi:tRNA (N(6)-L-threonylcarbamoyladenosine(37)-C(2))-methylthiotransferase MtaB [Roseimaritima sediminicola]|uniref:tRNA (N(6)-L-threonylcarbamoyladenosine(37)-C(2))- methylthiotransferase MtaB n=1 Tax=Roseimaritima sediminicola TaxID=2662066 RepID=UPI00129857F3|nr:tRNA (N(6)-L-threonylcarbamoyladenosine(37)-C(2))-methylthiotransferase MtaB [Roseimaritima sediminicola]